MDTVIRVVIIERDPVYRMGLAAVLGAAGDIEVAGSGDTVAEAYRLTDDIHPDVAIVGTTCTAPPGIDLAGALRHRHPAVAVIVIAENESDDELFSAIRVGASAYTGHDITVEGLLEFVRRSATGEYIINEQLLSKPYVAARVIDQFRGDTRVPSTLSNTVQPLTDRELGILRGISDGLTNAEIGAALGIGTQTVKNNVTSILRKLAVNDRTQAVMTAFRRGWLTIEKDVRPDEERRGLTDKPTSRLGTPPPGDDPTNR